MNFEDELLLDAATDAEEVAFIQECLKESNVAMEEDDIYYLIDLLATYYAESGILDVEPDADGFVDIPMDAIVEYVQKTAQREIEKVFDEDTLALVVEADMDFAEENL